MNKESSVIVAANISEAIVTSRSIVIVQYWLRWQMIDSDPDDNKFFDIAIASNADYLVTNDAYFNIAKRTPFPSIKVVSAVEFLQILKPS